MGGIIQISLLPVSKAHLGYGICGLKIIANRQLELISAFKTDHSVPDSHEASQGQTKSAANRVFHGTSILAGVNREIICWRDGQGYEIHVPESADYRIDTKGSSIHQISDTHTGLSGQEHEQILLGPPLMLALALNNHFAMHASAVKVNGNAVLFTGESGLGKSTLARWLKEHAGIERLSDDISVLGLENGVCKLHCDFPQLKLQDSDQHVNTIAVSLGAVLMLNRNNAHSTATLTRLDSMEAIKVLLNNAVAAQLFDNSLNSSHLAFVSILASQTTVFKLDYPDGEDKIPAIADLLTDNLT